MEATPDGLAAQRAAQQRGLLTHAQLRSTGLSQRQIDGRVRTGRLQRTHTGVFVVAGAPVTFEREAMAAVLAGGAQAVASHGTAAALWGFPNQECDRPIEITSPRARLPRIPSVRVHRSVHLDDTDVRSAGGIPCTSVPRSLVDLTAVRGIGWLARSLDDALRRNRATVTDIRACAERLAGAPGRRPSVIRMLVAERLAIGGGRTESWLERTVLQVLLDATVPPPVPQYPVMAGGHRYRLDFAWPDQRVALEVDGYLHSTYAAVQHDRERDLHLRSEGWTVLRVTGETPAPLIVASVLDALAR